MSLARSIYNSSSDHTPSVTFAAIAGVTRKILKGHMTATRAYAWTSPVEGSDKRRFFAVLHEGLVKSPADAVRAAIVAEHRG